MSGNFPEVLVSEWSYPVLSDDIVNKPQNIRFEANEEQCSALARRLGVDSLAGVVADLVVRRNSGNMVVYIQGSVKARVTQNCVVSLEPIQGDVVEKFEAWFADADQAVSFARAKQQMMSQKMGEETPILAEEEDPEPIIDGVIDFGELATQYLALAIDSYPHAEGVHYEVGDDTVREDASDIRKNPFAKLKEWKDKV